MTKLKAKMLQPSSPGRFYLSVQKMESYFEIMEHVCFLDCALSGLCTRSCDEMCASIMKEPVCVQKVLVGWSWLHASCPPSSSVIALLRGRKVDKASGVKVETVY